MKSDDEGEERVQVDPEEGEAEEQKKGTRSLRWANFEDNEEEEKGRQEATEGEWHRKRAGRARGDNRRKRIEKGAR